jgi:hypothetical protein
MILTTNYFLFRSDDTVNKNNVKIKYEDIAKITKNKRFINSQKAIIILTNDKREMKFKGFETRTLVYDALIQITKDFCDASFKITKKTEEAKGTSLGEVINKYYMTISPENEEKEENNQELDSSSENISLYSFDDIEIPKEDDEDNILHAEIYQNLAIT